MTKLKECNKCDHEYGIHCREDGTSGRYIEGSAKFKGVHSIQECLDNAKTRVFLTLIPKKYHKNESNK